MLKSRSLRVVVWNKNCVKQSRVSTGFLTVQASAFGSKKKPCGIQNRILASALILNGSPRVVGGRAKCSSGKRRHHDVFSDDRGIEVVARLYPGLSSVESDRRKPCVAPQRFALMDRYGHRFGDDSSSNPGPLMYRGDRHASQLNRMRLVE